MAAGGALGLGALAFYGLGLSNKTGAIESAMYGRFVIIRGPSTTWSVFQDLALVCEGSY